MSKNKRKKTRTEEMKKVKFDNWLGIGNLVLTAFIGIFVAIFLSYRDEQTQKELIQLQADIEAQTQKELVQLQADIESQTQKELLELQSNLAIESSQAHIEIENICMYHTSCDGSFIVRNTGRATAKDIKVLVVFDSIANKWITSITDINNFTVKQFPATLEANIQEKKVDVLYYSQEVSGQNALEIQVRELPVNGEFKILLSL